MSSNPDQIRREIEETRAELSGDVNALADSVKPSTVARRQADKVKSGVASVKDSIMGNADDASSSVSDAAGSVSDKASDAKSAVRRQARGNPLAAGLVAFAGGWLLSSLLPATQAERQGAAALKEKAQPLAETVGSELSSVAKDVAENLKEPARDAVEQVKSSAADSAATVKDEAKSTASDVKDSSQQAATEVRQQS
jgi:gas vesicle protein